MGMSGHALGYLAMLAFVAAACENRSPVSRFNSCVLAGVVAIEHGGEEKARVDCGLPAEVLVVGRPRGQVNSDELIKAGLSKNLAETLAGSRESAQWCAVEEYDPKPIPLTRIMRKYRSRKASALTPRSKSRELCGQHHRRLL